MTQEAELDDGAFRGRAWERELSDEQLSPITGFQPYIEVTKMKRIELRFCWFWIAMSAIFTNLAVKTEKAYAVEPSKPNIVLILADDFGLDGVSCYGSDKHKTPNIDKLVASGLRFQTCYASPLCGPTRCLLMTGRYAFRTGGITNHSWRANGPGAKSSNEYPMARMLKDNGYATGMAGKWRQVGETPRDWGFDEYTTDPTAGGWFWKNEHLRNGEDFTDRAQAYAPDSIHQFSMDFIAKHKNHPFFFYYSMHHVHGPIQRTPETKDGVTDQDSLYEDNIRYLDKQVGAVVAELEKHGLREKTLILFTADNGTALTFPSTIGGRMINGKKASMLEGGSRVPMIASWPGVTPAGKVSQDMISLADPYATFAELAGAKMSAKLTVDGQSFAAQLQGKPGKPRDWVYVQLGKKWFVREADYKMNESGELFEMKDAPFQEKLVASGSDNNESTAARTRLTNVLSTLNPDGGKVDEGGQAKKNAKNGKRRAAKRLK
ncbi:MAG: sulfatase-like hydrolase/transferase [Pirellula sp.]